MKIEFSTHKSTILRTHDFAWVEADESLAASVAEAVVDSLSTSIEVDLGGTRIHLAALLDPDHWDEDWAQVGVVDVEEFLRGLVTA